ncbi:MAG: preprotein translocase subunit YajC [Salinibacterium sp.]|nr:preprotein translocase subunit YajC [Salinibacterium sp.]
MDPLTIGMLVILAVLIFFMFRNSRKRKAQMEELRTQIVPGAEIMTNFGLYGTLVSIDELSKVAEVETSPGNIVRVHSQTIAKVVEDHASNSEPGSPRSVEEAMEIANREADEREERKRVKLNESSIELLADPQFGERVTPEAKKPVRRAVKKVVE